jgi:hypothetical protein
MPQQIFIWHKKKLPQMQYMMIVQFLYFWNENLKLKIYIYVK